MIESLKTLNKAKCPPFNVEVSVSVSTKYLYLCVDISESMSCSAFVLLFGILIVNVNLKVYLKQLFKLLNFTAVTAYL